MFKVNSGRPEPGAIDRSATLPCIVCGAESNEGFLGSRRYGARARLWEVDTSDRPMGGETRN